MKRMTRTQESRIEYLTILTAETIGRLDFMIAEAEGPVAEVNKTTSIEIADDLRAAQEALFRVVKANRRLVDAYYAELLKVVGGRDSVVIPEMPGVQSPEVEDGDALIAAKVCEFCSEQFNSEAGYLAHECDKTPFGLDVFEG